MPSAQFNGVLRTLRRAAILRDGCDLTDTQFLEAFLSRGELSAFEVLSRRYGHFFPAVRIGFRSAGHY